MLNNLKYWLGTFLFNTKRLSRNTSATHKSYANSMTDIEGNAVTGYNERYTEYYATLGFPSTNDTTQGVCIHIGTGETDKTSVETHSLENDVTDNLSLVSLVSDIDNSNGKTRLLLTANYQNKTSTDITINEIGFVFINQDYNSTDGHTYNKVLFDRKSKADGNFTPTTLCAGESKVFVYALEI